MKIRKGTPEDKDHFHSLYTHFEENTALRLPEVLLRLRAHRDVDEAVNEEVGKLFSKPERITFIALEGDKPAGFIFGEIKEGKNRVYDKEGYIDSWYVEPEFQGTGIGKLLFDALVEEFKKADCTHLALKVHADNARAIQIYEGMGFLKRVIGYSKPLKDL